MKLLFALLATLLSVSVVADAQECDWQVSRKIDPMTDKDQCLISSSSAAIALSANSESVTFLTGSAYARHGDSAGLRIRIDDNAVISMSPKGLSTSSFEEDARNALRQILLGKRLRTSYLDYPDSRVGDAQICSLPELLADCGAPLDRLKDTRSQAEIIKAAMGKKAGR